MSELLPPPDENALDKKRPSRKRRGKRHVSGSVMPMPSSLPLLSPEDIERAMHPEYEDFEIPDIAVPEYHKEEVDPTRLSSTEQSEFQAILQELHERDCEALTIFEPMPEQERFFSSEASERVALGGNRGGKTIAVVVEIARAVTNQDPYEKYGDSGKFILVGRDLTHCSKVFYENLFLPGAFKVIKDLETGKLRGYRPNDPEDQKRQAEAKDAPPLIPARFYDYSQIAWENKKDSIPKTIPLKNGWTLYFFSGLGGPPQGWKVKGVAFDEEIEHPRWYPEMAMRLPDQRVVDPVTRKVRNGKFIWSATPQAGTQQLYDLKIRGDDCFGDPKPVIENFMFTMLMNPYLDDAAKAEAMEKLKDNEDEAAVRIHGQFALLGTRVYPEFAPGGVHGCEPFDVPDDWTRYAFVDPGRQVCAVMFVAIPPPSSEWRGRKVIYDELYLKRCDAKIFASNFVARTNGHAIQKGIIDHRGGRLTEIGSGKTPEEQYVAALKAEGFRFVVGGCNFEWSSDDLVAGITAVHGMLHVVDGKSEIVVMRNRVPKLLWEMDRYSYKKLPSGIVTDEPIKRRDHQCDNLRYMAQARLPYVKPPKRARAKGYTTLALEAKRERAKARKNKEGGFGGSFKVW